LAAGSSSEDAFQQAKRSASDVTSLMQEIHPRIAAVFGHGKQADSEALVMLLTQCERLSQIASPTLKIKTGIVGCLRKIEMGSSEQVGESVIIEGEQSRGVDLNESDSVGVEPIEHEKKLDQTEIDHKQFDQVDQVDVVQVDQVDEELIDQVYEYAPQPLEQQEMPRTVHEMAIEAVEDTFRHDIAPDENVQTPERDAIQAPDEFIPQEVNALPEDFKENNAVIVQDL
jgi:hypothetical protein